MNASKNLGIIDSILVRRAGMVGRFSYCMFSAILGQGLFFQLPIMLHILFQILDPALSPLADPLANSDVVPFPKDESAE